MAMPVDFREFTPADSRDDLMRRLERAPREHVEALLSLFELLQRMHEKGVIDLGNGLLSAGDTVVDKIADLVNSQEITNVTRLTFMLINLIKAMDVNKIHGLLSGAQVKPASLFQLGRQALNDDVRLGMTVGLGMLAAFGAAIREQQADHPVNATPSHAESITARFFQS